MQVWINGRFTPETEACLNVQDEGIRYGNGLFETIRIYQGYPFLLSRHITRMYQSARTLGFDPYFPPSTVAAAADELIAKNQITEGILRLFCTAEKNLWMTVSLQVPYPDCLYGAGIKAMMARVRRNETSLLSTLKTLNYLENAWARNQAFSSGFQEAIFLNTRGHLAEGATTNLFLVKNQTLITPCLTAGILPGITRETVLKLAQRRRINTEVRETILEELWAADECFLTSSLREIMPLINIDHKVVGAGKPGAITLMLREEYRKLILKNRPRIQPA